MELVSLAKNPVPSGGTVGSFRGYDGAELRYARWDATRMPRRGTVCLFERPRRVHREILRGHRRSAAPRLRRRHHGLARPGRLAAHAVQPAQGPCARLLGVRPRPHPLHEGHRAAGLPAAVHRPRAFHGRQHPAAQCHDARPVVRADRPDGADDRDSGKLPRHDAIARHGLRRGCLAAGHVDRLRGRRLRRD